MIDFFQKIYYINLDDDVDKKQYFEKEITKSSLSSHCERFKAVSGKHIDLRLINSKIISSNARKDIELKKQKTYGISLTYGSLGCALSHKLIYEECSYDTKPYLVFEDDIILHKNFDPKLQELINVIQKKDISFDIIYLGYNEIPGFYKVDIDSVLSKPSGLITGTYGYILSPNGCKKLLDHIFPLNHQIDSSISHNLSKFNIYCTSTKLIQASTSFGSKTQMCDSCINIQSLEIDNWIKLFA